MAGDTGHFDMDSFEKELDGALRDVMPPSWEGHARYIIREADLSQKQQKFALRLSRRLLDKTDHSASKVAEQAIGKAREKV